MSAIPKREYDAARDSVGTPNNFGMYILKKGARAVLKKPSWKGTETVFRIYPGKSREGDGSGFEPFVVDPGGQCLQTDWVRRYNCAWNVGTDDRRVTYLIQQTADDYECRFNPLTILYRAINDAIKSKQERAGFGSLLKGSASEPAALTTIKNVFLLQCALLVHNSKSTYGHGTNFSFPPGVGDQPPCVLALSGGGGTGDYSAPGRIIADLKQLKPGVASGDAGSFEEVFKYGDPVSPDHGVFVHMFESGCDPRKRQGMTDANPAAASGFYQQAAQAARQNATSGKEIIGFDYYIDRGPVGGASPQMNSPEALADLRDHLVYWEHILDFPSIIEQARMLNTAFPPQVIEYAFDNYNRDWVTDETRHKLKNPVSVNVPPQQPFPFPQGGPGTEPPSAATGWPFNGPTSPAFPQTVGAFAPRPTAPPVATPPQLPPMQLPPQQLPTAAAPWFQTASTTTVPPIDMRPIEPTSLPNFGSTPPVPSSSTTVGASRPVPHGQVDESVPTGIPATAVTSPPTTAPSAKEFLQQLANASATGRQ